MKRYVRNTINLSCAKILLTSVIEHNGDVSPEEGKKKGGGMRNAF